MIERILKKLFRTSTIGPALTRYYICPRVKLHHIHSSDDGMHSHPWNGISIIFGSYNEFIDGELHKRRFFNRIYAHSQHRVFVDKPVWTLFIHGPRINEKWTYNGQEKPWEGSDDERD